MTTGPRQMTRRSFVGAVFAAGAAASFPAAASAPLRRWEGQALGAHATIALVGAPEALSRQVFGAVEGEIRRLEAIFSLYRADSAVSRLNRTGRLAAPAPELLEVLAISAAAHRRTGGLFDPTVQPLFAHLARHFASGGTADRLSPDSLAAVLGLVGFNAVRFDPDRIEFAKPGMALTLNGIAQGYVTDRVVSLLRRHGFGNMLVDIGEIGAVGAGPRGRGWRVGIQQGIEEGAIAERLSLVDKAVATSMLKGTAFDGEGRVGHILHPKTGIASAGHGRVTVIADSAAVADALSTAGILMDAAGLDALRRSGFGVLAG